MVAVVAEEAEHQMELAQDLQVLHMAVMQVHLVLGAEEGLVLETLQEEMVELEQFVLFGPVLLVNSHQQVFAVFN